MNILCSLMRQQKQREQQQEGAGGGCRRARLHRESLPVSQLHHATLESAQELAPRPGHNETTLAQS